MQHACRIANATAIECHIDHPVLYMLRLARVGIVEEKGTAFARLLTAAVALLALGTGTMSDNIDPITVRTVEHKCNHSSLGKRKVVLLLPRGYQIHSCTTPSTCVGQWCSTLHRGVSRTREVHDPTV